MKWSEEDAKAEETEESEIAEDAEKESETIGGSVGVNVGKTARKIAAAKTTSQLRAVIAEIKGDMQEVKAGIEKDGAMSRKWKSKFFNGSGTEPYGTGGR